VLDLWTDLLGCLDLHIERERSESDNVTVFEGVSQQLDYHRVFGGQLLGQFIRAASLACPDKTVKSLHAVFAREGRADEPVRYRATRQHEGRSFASLTITAEQPLPCWPVVRSPWTLSKAAPKTKTAKRFRRCWTRHIGSNST
jgi:acyl-CoA thioesterase-2